MQHIKLFEAFTPARPVLEEKTFITIDLIVIGWPDEDYEVSALGISKNPIEAAAFALSAALNWLYSMQLHEEEWIKSIEKANGIIRELVWVKPRRLAGSSLYRVTEPEETPTNDEILTVLTGLKNGSIDESLFNNISDVLEATCRVYKKVTAEYGGYSFGEDKGGIGWADVK